MLTVKSSFLLHRKWNTIKLNAGCTNGVRPVKGSGRAGVGIILQKKNNSIEVLRLDVTGCVMTVLQP